MHWGLRSCKESWISCCRAGAKGGAPPSFSNTNASSMRAHPADTCNIASDMGQMEDMACMQNDLMWIWVQFAG